MGDILALIDKAGNKVVEYKYDSWGRIVDVSGSMAGSLGKKNPFRYRGYYYDEETGLYYLRRRYYDSTLQRFISADKKDTLLLRAETINNKNLFLYCDNNPTIRSDSTGALWCIVGAIFGAAVSVCSQVFVERKSVDELDWIDVACSAISGAVATTALKWPVQTAVNAALGGIGSLVRGDEMGDVILNTTLGALSGCLGGDGAGFKKMQMSHRNRMYNMSKSFDKSLNSLIDESKRYMNRIEWKKQFAAGIFLTGYGMTKAPQIAEWGTEVIESFIDERQHDRYVKKTPRFGHGPIAMLF